MKLLVNLDGVTVKQLKELIKNWPETNDMGDPTEVWLDGGQVKEIWPLNKDTSSADILISLNQTSTDSRGS